MKSMLMVVEEIMARRTGGYLYGNSHGAHSKISHSLVRLGHDHGLPYHEYRPGHMAALFH